MTSRDIHINDESTEYFLITFGINMLIFIFIDSYCFVSYCCQAIHRIIKVGPFFHKTNQYISPLKDLLSLHVDK